jgi:5,10-methylenetetrahydromethanopterin reductase
MRLAVGLYPSVRAADVLRLARRCDELGYDGVWLTDSSLLWREAYSLLGAIAAGTERVSLGTAVTNPITRRLTVTAGAALTLAELSGGRAILGLGNGDSALRTEGLRPARVDELRAAIGTLRRLLAGEEADAGGGVACRVTYARPGDGAPIYVAASGPRMLALAGEVADGVILMNGVSSARLGAAIDVVRSAAAAAGRDPGAVRVVVWTACVAAHDAAAAVDSVKYNVARAILRTMPGTEEDGVRACAERLRAHYDFYEHGRPDARFAELVPDELVPMFALAGTPDQIRARAAELEGLGVDELALAIPDVPAVASRDSIIDSLRPVAS